MTPVEPSKKKKELQSKFIGFWSGIVGRENFVKFYGGTNEEAQEVYDFYLSEITKLINDESNKRKMKAKEDAKKPHYVDGKLVGRLII